MGLATAAAAASISGNKSAGSGGFSVRDILDLHPNPATTVSNGAEKNSGESGSNNHHNHSHGIRHHHHHPTSAEENGKKFISAILINDSLICTNVVLGKFFRH